MFWLRLSGWLFVLLLTATAVVMVLGSRLPAVGAISATSVVRASPDRIWPLLSDAAAQPQWRSDVAAVELLPESDGLPCWSERHDRTLIPVCMVARGGPRRLKLRIADARLAFQGERSFALAADPVDASETRVTGERNHFDCATDGALLRALRDERAEPAGAAANRPCSGGLEVAGPGCGDSVNHGCTLPSIDR